MEVAIEDRNLKVEDQNLDAKDQNLNAQVQKLNVEDQRLSAEDQKLNCWLPRSSVGANPDTPASLSNQVDHSQCLSVLRGHKSAGADKMAFPRSSVGTSA